MNRQNEAPRSVDRPEVGFFAVRLVPKGPWVAARIEYDVPLWSASIQGQACGEPNEDPWYVDGLARIWHGGRRIDEDEYRKLLGADHGHPATQRVDVNRMKAVW